MMSDAELEELGEDIFQNGQCIPAMTWNGMVIDGRNRIEACKRKKIEPLVKDCSKQFDDEAEVITFIISMNLKRRQLTASQKAVLAVELLPMFESAAKARQQKGSEKIPYPEQGKASEKAAAATGSNAHYVADAKQIKDEAPEEFEAIRKGEKNISQVKRELKDRKLMKSGVDRELVEEGKLIDSAVANLTSATKALRKCIDQYGITKASRTRVEDALSEIASVLA